MYIPNSLIYHGEYIFENFQINNDGAFINKIVIIHKNKHDLNKFTYL